MKNNAKALILPLIRGGGYSVTSKHQNISIGSAYANILIFLLPDIIFEIIEKGNTMEQKGK